MTNDQFAKFVEATKYVTMPRKKAAGHLSESKYVKGIDWQHPLDPKRRLKGKGDHPVVQCFVA